jgi:hypothetical protein
MITTLSMLRLSDRDRRTLIRGAGAIALLIGVGNGVPAWVALQHDTRASAAELAADAARADAEIAALPKLRDSLRARSARLNAIVPSLVAGDGPAASAAMLASLITDAANDAGTKLGALQPRVDSEPRPLGAGRGGVAAPRAFTRVSVHGDVTADVLGLTQFLAELEHGPVLLVVRELGITQPEPAAPSDRMETLHAEFAVVGLAPAAASTRDSRRATPASSKRRASASDRLAP